MWDLHPFYDKFIAHLYISKGIIGRIDTSGSPET